MRRVAEALVLVGIAAALALASPEAAGAAGDKVRLRNRAQNLCLDFAGSSGEAGAVATLGRCDGGRDQYFTLDAGAQLVSEPLGLCLDVAGEDGAKGRDVVLSRCEGKDDHRWWLAPTGRGFFELRGRLKDLCLDPKRRAGKRGARLSMSPCDDYPDQQWSFEAEDGRTRETALASLFASQPRAPFLSVPPIFRLRHGVLWALRRCLEAGRAGGRGGDDPEV